MDGPLLGEREFDSPRNGVEALVAPSSMMWIAMKSSSGVLGREASDIDNVDLKDGPLRFAPNPRPYARNRVHGTMRTRSPEARVFPAQNPF